MSATVADFKISDPGYFHREYENDLPQDSSGSYYADQCKRVALVALPFLSLYKPLGFPLSLAMGGLRSVTTLTQFLKEVQAGDLTQSSYAFLQTLLAVAALSGTLLAHPLGMLITTVHDCAFDCFSVGQNLFVGDFQAALGSSANLVNNALYLALFTHGGLEIAIASLAMQVFIGISHSASEYQKGNYLEAGGHLLMGMIRTNQMIGRLHILQIKYAFDAQIQKFSSKSHFLGTGEQGLDSDSLNSQVKTLKLDLFFDSLTLEEREILSHAYLVDAKHMHSTGKTDKSKQFLSQAMFVCPTYVQPYIFELESFASGHETILELIRKIESLEYKNHFNLGGWENWKKTHPESYKKSLEYQKIRFKPREVRAYMAWEASLLKKSQELAYTPDQKTEFAIDAVFKRQQAIDTIYWLYDQGEKSTAKSLSHGLHLGLSFLDQK